MTNKILVVETLESKEKTAFYSLMTTLVSLIVVGLIAYGLWVLFLKVLGFAAVVYLAVFAFLAAKNLFKKPVYAPITESMDATYTKWATEASTPKEDGTEASMTKEQAYGWLAVITVVIVLGTFLHLVISTLLFYNFGQIFAGHLVSWIGLALTVVYGFRAFFWPKNVYSVFKNARETPKPVSKMQFWFWIAVHKAQSLAVLTFLAMLLAAKFGIFLGF